MEKLKTETTDSSLLGSSAGRLNRREMIALSFSGVGVVATGSVATGMVSQRSVQEDDAPGPDYKIENGRAKQSVMAWCLKPMPMETLIPACAAMGLSAMEGIDKKYYPLMKENGLKVSICGSHGFANGPINRDNHEMVEQKLREGIDLAVEWESPGVITFTGMREAGISDEAAFKNCVECWQRVAGYAEEKNINLVLEMLNSRDGSHPMKGHPGYFGDDIDRCLEMIQAVESPRMKLLFDVYHVQIMNGDVIRRFRDCSEFVSHVHTAGNPGRCELDTNQEINYPAVIRAILDTGFDGYVAQEFIPTWEDKLAALRHGVMTCDVE